MSIYLVVLVVILPVRATSSKKSLSRFTTVQPNNLIHVPIDKRSRIFT